MGATKKNNRGNAIRTPLDLYYMVATKILTGFENGLKKVIPVKLKPKKKKSKNVVVTQTGIIKKGKDALQRFFGKKTEKENLQEKETNDKKDIPEAIYIQNEEKEKEIETEKVIETENEEPEINRTAEREQELEDLRADKSEEQEIDIDR